MTHADIVIVGAGQGGFQVAASLRDEGFEGSLLLIGDECGLPYQRPPLSKAFLAGTSEAARLLLRPETFFAQRNIDSLDTERVVGINREKHCLALGTGRSVGYGHLVLATGARARELPVPGAGLGGVLPLRTRADAQHLRERLAQAQRVVVVGAGFIGLEVAVVAHAMGLNVQVLEFAPRALQRAVSEISGNFLAQALTASGVRLSLCTGVTALEGGAGKVSNVLTNTGQSLAADLVVVGIGVQPNTELAQACKLPVDDGILVDQLLLTADPAISALGDCARFPAPYAARPVRLESVQNAVDQARCIAARLCGKPAPYDKLPWFWSDQGENRLQIAGVCDSGDEAVLRGDIASGKFSVLRYRGGQLRAVESINQTADHMGARKLLAQGLPVPREQAADPLVKLASLAG